ncbi:MAG: hypothetical protein GDA68_06745 [Nitrospira sp. CR2.1]|nr:hypothetical protein [Nitrospira sp. CR2.1]
MIIDPPIGTGDRIRAKLRGVGLSATLRMGLLKAIRFLGLRWSSNRQVRRSYRVEREALAAALDTTPNQLDKVMERLNTDLGSRLPFDPAQMPAMRTYYREQAPDKLAAVVESADQVCKHVFDLLGSGPVFVGDPIDWHRDVKSGYRWESTVYFADIPHGQGNGVDIKVPWELSRGHHLVLLAQAAQLTGEEKYARECMAQMTAWIEANQPGYGVNWACPMDVAIRAVNWLWALALMVDCPLVARTWVSEVLASMVAHGRFLMDNLELRDDGVTANHYLANVVGLLYLGLCLKEVREAGRWRDFAVRELVREMDRQVLTDGFHFESSVSYHRLVTECFLSSAALCRRHGVELPPGFHRRLEKMCDVVAGYTKPNGLAPQIGDGDNGRLHILTGYGHRDARDHRHLLGLGAWYFDRADWRAAAGPSWIEGLWFGADPETEPPPAEASIRTTAFPVGGFYVLRHERHYLLVNCNPPGTNGVGTHKHNDVLSVELHIGGEDILVDPGCFLYTSDPQAYNRFRSTRAHSTVSVDQAEQNRLIPGKLFCLHPDSRVQVVQWEPGGPVERLVAEHDGYERLSHPVRHRREIVVDGLNETWHVTDRLTARDDRPLSHHVEWTLTFAPHCSLLPARSGWHVWTLSQRLRLEGPRLWSGGSVIDPVVQIQEGLVAPQYGQVQPAPVLRWSWDGVFPVESRVSIVRVGAGSS